MPETGSTEAGKNRKPDGKWKHPDKGRQTEYRNKQMPAFDPDAELKGLTFTVSAWKNAVSRAKEKTDFNKATVVGRYRLKHALDDLLTEINELNRMLEVYFND